MFHVGVAEVELAVDPSGGSTSHFGAFRHNHPLVAQTNGAFEEAAVNGEDVAGVCFTAGGAAQNQRHLAISPRLLGKVVVHHEGITAVFHKILAHRATRVGGEELHWRGVRGAGNDDDGVLHRPVLFQCGHYLGYLPSPLANGDVNADDTLPLLVDDGVEGDGGLARLAVANDEFALATADGGHRVHGHQPRLHGGVHPLALNNTGGDAFNGKAFRCLDGAFAINGGSERVYDTADEGIPHGNRGDLAGGADFGPCFNGGVVAHDGNTHCIWLQVQHNAAHAVAKLDDFAGGDVGQTIGQNDTVVHCFNSADATDGRFALKQINLLEETLGDILIVWGEGTHETTS